MADRKISDLTALTTPATGDLIPIVDISEAAAADKNKSITVGELLRGAPDGTAAAPGIAFESDGGNGMFLGGTDILAFSTGGSQAVTIDASQRVGIGTSSVDRLFHVEHPTDNILARFESGDANANIEFADNTTTTPPTVGANGDNLRLGTGGTSAIEIDSSQRVGIGTTSPDNNLHIFTDTNGEGILVKSTGNSSNSLDFDANRSAADGGIGAIRGKWNGTTVAQITFNAGSDTTNKDDGYIVFGTESAAPSGNANAEEKMRLDSSGRLLVGTSSSILNDNFLQVVADTTNNLALVSGRDDIYAPRVDFCKSRGSTASPTSVNNADQLANLTFRGYDGSGYRVGASIEAYVDNTPGANDMPGRLVFSTTADGASSPTERLRIANDGYLYASSSSTSNTNLTLKNGPAAANSTDFLQCRDSSNTLQLVIEPDGDVKNTNNSYAAISDVKLKENIVDAGSQWEDIKALRVRNYNFKASTGHSTHRQIGVIAQELELVSPGLVKESIDTGDGPDGEREVDLGTTTKSVNYSVLYMKAVKALQEAMGRIEQLEAKVAALEAS